MNLILLGPPGAGKGTQAKKIEIRLGISQISTGDMLRSAISRDIPIGRQIKKIIHQGRLVPDPLIIQLIAERIEQPDCKNGFIFDGFPRTITQAKALDNLLAKKKMSLDCVLMIEVDEERLTRRITGRFSCTQCHTNYHEEFKKPTQENICDFCGGTRFHRREDDKEDILQTRLIQYRKETEPLLFYYKKKGILIAVNGMADINTVEQKIVEILESIKK